MKTRTLLGALVLQSMLLSLPVLAQTDSSSGSTMDPNGSSLNSSTSTSTAPPAAPAPTAGTPPPPDSTTMAGTPAVPPAGMPIAPPPADEPKVEHTRMQGISLQGGAGVEGYTSTFAPRLAVGPTWQALVGFRFTRAFGLELGYNGATTHVKTGGVAGPNLTRNGVHAVATFGLSETLVQPYVLAGVGIDWYSAAQGADVYGFFSDRTYNIPVGAGLRLHIPDSPLFVDLRGTYSFLFNERFAGRYGQVNATNSDNFNGGRWAATANIGVTL